MLTTYIIFVSFPSSIPSSFIHRTKKKKQIHSFGIIRSDTESHVDVDKTEKRKYTINLNLNNLFKRGEKSKATESNDAEQGKLSEDENAAPSESTVIIEDEPSKKVKLIELILIHLELAFSFSISKFYNLEMIRIGFVFIG